MRMNKLVFVLALAIPAMAFAQQSVPRTKMEMQLKGNFARMDANKDGVVTRAESNAARDARMNAQYDAAFAQIDADGNGSISKAEFVTAQRRAISRATGGRPLPDPQFDQADLNKDGKVTLAEATALPLRVFDAADTNKDGVLTPAEQQAAAKKQRARR
jgi:Ca2+-binding EF-hand superfamily protein